jgi:hypothetical protein
MRALNVHSDQQIEKFGTTFAIGDKVMQIENVCPPKQKHLRILLTFKRD